MSIIKIGIFDDHPIVSNGVISFFSNHLFEVSVMFCASTREDLIKNLEKSKPDLLILDIVAPDVTGLDLFTELIKQHKSIKIIAYSTLKSHVLVENLLSIGVKGFVNKNQQPEDLLQAIKDVYYDLIYVPEKYKFLTSRFREPVKNTLSNRETEILLLISKEATTEEIALKLNLSTKTIENQKLSLFKKLEVKNAAGLILAATRLGYIS